MLSNRFLKFAFEFLLECLVFTHSNHLHGTKKTAVLNFGQRNLSNAHFTPIYYDSLTHSARPTTSENISGHDPQPFNNNLRTPLIGCLGWIVTLLQLSHSYSNSFSSVCTSFSRVVLSHLLKFLCELAIWNDSSQRLTNLCLIIHRRVSIVYRYTPLFGSRRRKKRVFGLVR